MQAEILSDVFTSLKKYCDPFNEELTPIIWHYGEDSQIKPWYLQLLRVKLRESTKLMVFQHVLFTKLGGHSLNKEMITTELDNEIPDTSASVENELLRLIYRAAAREWKDWLWVCVYKQAVNDAPNDVEATALTYFHRDWL
jgi:hypothetical protein